MSVYVGLGEESKEISGIFLGAEESVKEVTEGYISDADGNVKEIYSGAPDPGQQVFTTSGTFTVPKGVKSVDVFLVGGGGAGGCGWNDTNGMAGDGGGGGYTKTIKGISVTPGNNYTATVGDGSTHSGTTTAYQGGTSSFNGYSCYGGYDGVNSHYIGSSSSMLSNWKNTSIGGSGGGCGAPGTSSGNLGGKGGSDGSNGYQYGYNYGSQKLCSSNWRNIYKGQGTTTRAFGESTGTLYSGGGGGGSWFYTTSSNNGGSGGGGTGGYTQDAYGGGYGGSTGTGGGGGGGQNGKSGGWGGSGCVIIRWGY